MVVLPLVPSVPFQRFSTTLDGVPYVIDVKWNGRAGVWSLDLLDEDEDPIRSGVRIVLGAVLGRRGIALTDPRMPTGFLVAIDLSGEGVDAGLDDLGDRVQVHYYSADETLPT